MPNIGPLEIGIVLVIALLVFGPKKLPDLGRSLGSSIREFKGSIGGGNDDDVKDAQLKDAQPEVTAEASTTKAPS